MHEGQQGEEAVADVLGVEEIAHQRAVEDRQPVEPFKRGHGDVLRQLVPGQHVAVDARGVDHPDQHHPGHPGEPAEPAEPVEGEIAQHVQRHGEHHRVRGVAVHAAQDAAQPPLRGAQLDHRVVGVDDAGLEEHVEVQAAAPHHPEQEEGDGAQVIEGIDAVAERGIEHAFDAQEEPLQQALDSLDHWIPFKPSSRAPPAGAWRGSPPPRTAALR